MNERIICRREFYEDRCVEITEHRELELEDGDVVKTYYSKYYCSPMGSGQQAIREFKKGEEGFEEDLRDAIIMLFRYNEKEYDRLIENLNNELLEKYFEKKYIPKRGSRN